jgi:hypothetical protein
MAAQDEAKEEDDLYLVSHEFIAVMLVCHAGVAGVVLHGPLSMKVQVWS